MGKNIRLGRLAGFPVDLHWSVLVIASLVSWSLAAVVLPQTAPGYGGPAYALVGVVTALLFLGSLLAHEMAHAVVARRAGVEVTGLTLWLFGGVATLSSPAATARDEMRIAGSGPLTSIGLAMVYGVVLLALAMFGVTGLAPAVVGWLAAMNLLLAGFNLIPGAPLDGGRLLRAYLWHRGGDPARAAVGAAHAGQAVGVGLMVLGFVDFAAGGGLGGLWLALIGWFIRTAAQAEESASRTTSVLAGVRVADAMSPAPQTAPGWFTVDDFIERYLLVHPHSAYPVEGPDGRITGLVTLGRLRAVPAYQRAASRIADVAVPIADVTVATPGEPLTAVIERLSPATGGRALVFDGTALVGILTPTDVSRAVEVRSLRADAPPQMPRVARML